MSLADEIEAASDPTTAPTTPGKKTSLADQIEAASPSTAASKTAVGAPAAPAYSPLGSDYENAAAGAGKAVADIGRGLGQIARNGLSATGNGAFADRMGLPTQADIDEAKQRDAALMETKAGIGGNIAGNVAATMLPLGLASRAGVAGAAALANPTTYGAAAASGALSGLLQPVATGENRLANTALGAVTGAGGNLAANTLGRIAQPVAQSMGAAGQRAAQVLQDAGVPLDAAQRTGSSFLRSVKSSFTDNPFTRGTQQAAAGQQQQAYNHAVLSTIGEPAAAAATSDVMGGAQQRINNVFHDVLHRNDIAIGDDAVNRIGAIQRAANDEEKTPVSNLANRIVGMVQQDGTVPGNRMYSVKKDLDRLASSPDSSLAFHARQLRSTVMDTINDSLPEADRTAFQQARQQFGNMKKIEPAIDKEGSGNISPSALANVMGQKANRGASIYGRGDQTLVDLAQSGKQLLGDKMPNSGTPARAAMQLALPALAGASGYYGAEDPGAGIRNAALAAGSMIVAPRLAQRAINSPGVANYFSQGLSGPLRNLLTSPQDSTLVGGSLRRLPGAALLANQPASK